MLTERSHPACEHLHKSGQNIPSIEWRRHRQVGGVKVGKVGDRRVRMRRIWRSEISWHGEGQLGWGADVKNWECRRQECSIGELIPFPPHYKHLRPLTRINYEDIMHEVWSWTFCFTCVCPCTHAGVDGALEIPEGGSYWGASRNTMPVRARLSRQPTRMHTLR